MVNTRPEPTGQNPAPLRLRKAAPALTLLAVALVAIWIVFTAVYDVTPRTIDPGTTACVYWPTNYAQRIRVGHTVTESLSAIACTVAIVATILSLKYQPRVFAIATGIVIAVLCGIVFLGSLIPDDPGNKLRQCPSSYLDQAGNPA